MNTRLQQFINAENISQSQLADTIGVARASVSHIIAGRNKPGFDFILGMARSFPALNIDWLITGQGRMYKSAEASLQVPERPQQPAKASITSDSAVSVPDSLFDEDIFDTAEAKRLPEPMPEPPETPLPPAVSRRSQVPPVKAVKRSISRVIVFYDDNTFEELS